MISDGSVCAQPMDGDCAQTQHVRSTTSADIHSKLENKTCAHDDDTCGQLLGAQTLGVNSTVTDNVKVHNANPTTEMETLTKWKHMDINNTNGKGTLRIRYVHLRNTMPNDAGTMSEVVTDTLPARMDVDNYEHNQLGIRIQDVRSTVSTDANSTCELDRLPAQMDIEHEHWPLCVQSLDVLSTVSDNVTVFKTIPTTEMDRLPANVNTTVESEQCQLGSRILAVHSIVDDDVWAGHTDTCPVGAKSATVGERLVTKKSQVHGYCASVRTPAHPAGSTSEIGTSQRIHQDVEHDQCVRDNQSSHDHQAINASDASTADSVVRYSILHTPSWILDHQYTSMQLKRW
jgi:hypothetical protein